MRAFVTWGTDEVLLDQQAGFADKLRDAGVDVTTYAAAKMPHDSAVIGAGLLYASGLGFAGVVRARPPVPPAARLRPRSSLISLCGCSRAPSHWD